MMRSPHAQLAWLSLAMFLVMTLWFSATAANAPIVGEFHLSAVDTAWLTMAVQAGFVLGTLVSALLNLPDVLGALRVVDVDRRIRVSRIRGGRRGHAKLAGWIGRRLHHHRQRRHRLRRGGRVRGSDRQGTHRRVGDDRQRTCAAVAGFLFHAPAAVLFVFTAVWGVAAVADSAQLSALVAEYSPRDHVGTALTIQTCVGFLLTMASIRLLPVAAQAIGWQWVFVLLVPGPFVGALALRGLKAEAAT